MSPNSNQDGNGESASTTSKSLQSTLLRLCLICASSQSALREEIPITILEHDTPSSSYPGNQLANQIRNDTLSLFSLIQKHTTALTLALKPTSKNSNGNHSTTSTSNSHSPTSQLDSASLKAAESQLQSLLSDITPKLAFLVLTAMKSRAIYRAEKESATLLSEEEQKMRKQVEAMGGTVYTSEQLGLKKESSKIPTEAVRLGGLGNSWANQLRMIVEEAFEKMGSLAESFMDQKTLDAVDAAQRARQKKAGGTLPSTNSSKKAPTSAKEARQLSLEKAKALDNFCQAVKDENRIMSKNEEVVWKSWKGDEEVMEDGERELRQAIKNSESSIKGTDPQDDDLSLDSLRIQDSDDDLTTSQVLRSASKALKSLELEDDEDQSGMEMEMDKLSETQRGRAMVISSLIRIGKLMHERIGSLCISTAASTPTSTTTFPRLDLDLLSQSSSALIDAQDDLICAALYGSKAFDELMNDLEDEEEGEEDEDEERDLNAVREACKEYVKAVQQLADNASIGVGEGGEEGEEGKGEKDPRAYFKMCASEIEKVVFKKGLI